MTLEKVRFFCFAASYSLALLLYLLSGLMRLPWRRVFSLAAVLAGLFAQIVYMGYRYEAGVVPLSTLYEALLVVIASLALAYVVLELEYPDRAFGAFVLPMIVALVVAAALIGEERQRVLPSGLWRTWVIVHAILLVAGALLVSVSFMCGLMYLVQVRRLKRKKLASTGWRLPSLETLERWTHRSLVLGFPLLTLGLAIGFAIALALRPGETTLRTLADPKVILAVITWCVLGAITLLHRNPRLRGRRIAYLTTIAFVLLAITTVGVELLLPSWHQSLPGGLS